MNKDERNMSAMKNDEIRQAVRQQYGQIAENNSCGCSPSCCGEAPSEADALSQAVGYSVAETGTVPEGANLGLGCGNPQAIAALKTGETVLDLGSGGGFDCFLAARQVGDHGRVVGVDMTPAMVSKARNNAEKGGYRNVEFRLGEIENLPVADSSIDVVISNCVINLSPDKPRVFAEAFRVLKPGGRLAISDVVAFAEMPDEFRQDMALLTGCMAGASLISAVEEMLRSAGFQQIRIVPKDESKSFIREWAPDMAVTDYVVAATIEAVKPATGSSVGREARPKGAPIEMRPAQPGDFPDIISLLTACHLPTDDLSVAEIDHFVVVVSANALVGVCGLEVFGSAGLPRSLAVAPAWRGHGIGERLICEIERRARSAGVEVLYLLTTTAQTYLLRLGYEDVQRDTVPAGIATHPQFRGLCPASAKCMSKRLV
jgi:N-acetylglutamate synthase-like GNAT family acetyltransferase/SAM-dependent methyltransferase